MCAASVAEKNNNTNWKTVLRGRRCNSRIQSQIPKKKKQKGKKHRPRDTEHDFMGTGSCALKRRGKSQQNLCDPKKKIYIYVYICICIYICIKIKIVKANEERSVAEDFSAHFLAQNVSLIEINRSYLVGT